MKKGTMSSSTLINESSILKPTKHPRAKKVSKSPELDLDIVLHKMGLDEKSVTSTGSGGGERGQVCRQDRSSGHEKSSGHDRSGQEYSQNETNSHSHHHTSGNSSSHSHSNHSKSRDSVKKRTNYSTASTLSPANTVVAAANLRHVSLKRE